jgi:CheY-like chemotaxis protein
MANKPVLFAIDDDPEVLRAVERDLRRRYARGRNGDGYRVLRANSADSALDTLGQLKLRGDTVALFLVDQRMPRTTGVEFLEETRDLYPEAKKVLLTAYADTDAAIKAINDIGLDYYLQKPWDPPEENLYPVLDDLLPLVARVARDQGFSRPQPGPLPVAGRRGLGGGLATRFSGRRWRAPATTRRVPGRNVPGGAGERRGC